MVIFDCNGVLVDSEPVAAQVAAEEFTRAGITTTPEIVSRFFTGRRTTDMCAAIETVTKRKLPPNFSTVLAAATLRTLGYRHAAALDGGVKAWRDGGLPMVKTG